MGMEFPIAQSLLSEMIRPAAAAKYIALMDGFWPLGFVAAGCLSYFLLPLTGWRSIFLVLALPAGVRPRHPLPDSRVAALAGAGRPARTGGPGIARHRSTGDAFAGPDRTAAAAAPAAAERSRPGFFSAFAELWSPAYRRRTLTVWGLWFFALLGFYGLTSWLSALLQQSGFAVTQSVYYTVLISLAGIPGFLCAAWLVEAGAASRAAC